MLTLINTNRMQPPIAPLGLDYVAAAAVDAGIETRLIDLCLDGENAADNDPFDVDFLADSELVGLSLRNVDDCFWPSGTTFLGQFDGVIEAVRSRTDAPLVIGGVGFSIFSRDIFEKSGVDFAIHGDGERAVVDLIGQLRGKRRFDQVEGLIWRDGDRTVVNPPAWPERPVVSPRRDFVDNATYFRLGGQIGIETKRGCARNCAYCADPLAKGRCFRLRPPSDVADEVEALLPQGVDVLHTCDAEFNLPRQHAMAVCDELIARRLNRRVRWYAYLAITPFDDELAERMARAGCVGINFTSDSACENMLGAYGQSHDKEDIARAVRFCRKNDIAVMLDLLLGGPGETPESVKKTVDWIKRIDPDCAGAAMGIRLYPGTSIVDAVAAEAPLDENRGILRHYDGPVDLLQPTFYISPNLGKRPAELVRDLIDDDPRFFPPEDEQPRAASEDRGDHNYNDNTALADAIAGGARGAYWDILRRL